MFDGTVWIPEEDRPICEFCDGTGGYDASRDCEEYDDWQECPRCKGSGFAEPVDDFVPERDAWTPND